MFPVLDNLSHRESFERGHFGLLGRFGGGILFALRDGRELTVSWMRQAGERAWQPSTGVMGAGRPLDAGRLSHTWRYGPLCALGRWAERHRWGVPMYEPRRAAPSAPSQIVSGDQGWSRDASGDRTTSPSQPSYRDEIEHTYLLLDENFDTLYLHCSTSKQKKQLSDTYSATRYTLWKVGQEVHRDESSVGTTASQDLKMANMLLTAMLKNLGDIGAVLSVAAEAVRLAASLTPHSADA